MQGPENRSALARAGWVVLGVLFVGIGAVGVVVPGLPTTPFLLLAAACFARSSPRLYAWLLRNKTFGPLIEDYRAGRGVSMKIKLVALAMMATFVTFALAKPLRDKPVPSVIVAGAALYGAWFVWNIPTRKPDSET